MTERTDTRMTQMKKSIVVIVALWPALALAGVDLNVNIGIPLPVPPPVVVAPPPGPPQVQLEAVPRFIYSPTLGFYVSVAIPYDIVFYNGGYYLNTSGGWYSASSFNGPWLYARHVPTMLRRYRYEDIHHYRDQEY